MADLKKLKAFSVTEASVTLWVFRKRTAKGSSPGFTGRWAEVGEDLAAALKTAVACEIARIEETIEYSLLAQNNESSALSISVIETHADAVKMSAAAETNDRRVRKERDLSNSVFYAVKFIFNDNVLLGVKKTDNSWKTKKKAGLIPFLFEDNTLVLDDKPNFNLSRYFDFLLLGDDIFVKEKGNFESILEYKSAHQDDFVKLCEEKDFENAFVDLSELKKYVGTNKIQLRRMAAIHEKKHYKNKTFMSNLRKDYAKAHLNINFDSNGKIQPTPETCKDIFQALLDFRLLSIFSTNLYDVQDTSVLS